MNAFLQAALEYEKLGYSVIPVIAGKKEPAVKWREFQTRRATPDEIKSWWEKYPRCNVGIVTGKISGLCVVDFDRYKEGYKVETELEYFPENLVVPSVTTPRKGTHCYFKDCGLSGCVDVFPGIDLRAEGNFIVAPPSANGTGNPYAWIEGMTLSDGANLELPSAFKKAIINKVNKTKSGILNANLSNSSISNSISIGGDYKGGGQDSTLTSPYKPYIILQEGTRDDDIFYAANWLLKGGRGEDYVRQMVEILAKAAKPPFPIEEVDIKIKSALQRCRKNLAEEVREFCFLQDGYFSITDILQTLHIITKEEKTNVHVVLKRLNDSGFIEKYGEKRGTYRLRKVQQEEMDITTESDVTEFPVVLPINLNQMAVVSPGNIIMVAGSKSAGKTAFLLNVAAFNMKERDIVFLNSEMSETEFKKRMKKFLPLRDWNMKAYKCHKNFDDFIESHPNRIYIIDFLEVHDNFYEVATPIRKIHEKLGDSICFIGLQMKLGASLGRGGDFSAEKARLYLTMDYDATQRATKMTIYDAKEPRSPYETVRGMHRMVKIINGNELKVDPREGWGW